MGGYCERFSETAGVGKGTSTDAGDLSRHNCFSLRGDLRLDVSDRRAAASIPSNIAEGCGRDGDAELARFCTIARGSASELEYQILLSRDLQLIQPDDYERLTQQAVEIKRMLTVLVQKLNAEKLG